MGRVGIAEVTAAIACGNIHTAAKCDGKMRAIAADAFRLHIHIARSFARVREIVAELNVLMDKIAYRPPSGPLTRYRA